MRTLKILVLSILVVILLSSIAFASFSTSGGSSSRHLEWVIDENVGCLSSSFCSQGLSSVQITFNGFSDHTSFGIIMRTSLSSSGSVVFRAIERIFANWTITKADSSIGSNGMFVLTQGTNRTTVFVNDHRYITIQQVRDFSTDVPAQQGSYGCDIVIGRACPQDVNAHLSVVQVSGSGSGSADSAALTPGVAAPDSGVGVINWIVFAQLGCFNSNFCQTNGASALRSEAGTWTLFTGHVAFGVILGAQYSSSGLVTDRYMEHVTATMWKIGPSSSNPKVNDFWIVSGVALTTTYKDGSQRTTTTQLNEVDTGAPAQQTVFNCAQLLGASCPNDVTAFETVTPVS